MPSLLARLAGLPRGALIGLVRAYRYLLSPWLGSACRFHPTCSAYALEALERHGALVGGTLSAWRLLRCHPWCAGGCDPVPPRPQLFTALLARQREADPSSANPLTSEPAAWQLPGQAGGANSSSIFQKPQP